MSGIYGYILNPAKQAQMPDTDRLKLWNAAYGKEAFSEEKLQNAVLGCFIEKLKDDAPRGETVWNRGKKTWVIDAVLYNHSELIEILSQGNPDKISDEELIILLVEKNGFDVLAKVNGDFAGAVYDFEENTVTLFRDHMGVRPLYYYASDECVCFSTDIRGILSVSTVDVSISEEWAFNTYFDFIDYSDVSTEYAKVFCVRPASFSKFSFKGNTHRSAKKYRRSLTTVWDIYREKLDLLDIDEHKYWQLGANKIRYKTEEEYIARMRELVVDSVKRRLDAFDGIAGAEFSGGLDSSLISILIHRMGRDCKYISWSMDPSDNPFQPADERRTIEDICRREGISCFYAGKTVDFSKSQVFNENYSKVVDVETDRPFYEKYAFWPMINTYELFTSANYVHENGGRVVFTGHGGDEGISHRTNPYEMWDSKEFGNYFEFFRDKLKGGKFSRIRAIKWGLSNAIRYKKRIRDALAENKAKIAGTGDLWQVINPDFIRRNKDIEPLRLTFCINPREHIINGGSRVRMDNVAMYGAYCNVRYMLPYLDYRLIDYAVSIERYMYLKGNNQRYILKQAFKDVLPDSLLGEIDKSDPSFGGVTIEPVPVDKQVESLKKKLRECLEYKNLSMLAGIFSVKDILSEIEAKTVTEQNYPELSRKCVRFFCAMKTVLTVDAAKRR